MISALAALGGYLVWRDRHRDRVIRELQGQLEVTTDLTKQLLRRLPAVPAPPDGDDGRGHRRGLHVVRGTAALAGALWTVRQVRDHPYRTAAMVGAATSVFMAPAAYPPTGPPSRPPIATPPTITVTPPQPPVTVIPPRTATPTAPLNPGDPPPSAPPATVEEPAPTTVTVPTQRSAPLAAVELPSVSSSIKVKPAPLSKDGLPPSSAKPKPTAPATDKSAPPATDEPDPAEQCQGEHVGEPIALHLCLSMEGG